MGGGEVHSGSDLKWNFLWEGGLKPQKSHGWGGVGWGGLWECYGYFLEQHIIMIFFTEAYTYIIIKDSVFLVLGFGKIPKP